MTLSHIDEKNNPTMVDISSKSETIRIARARAIITYPEILIPYIENDEIQGKKGPVIQTAIIAGTMACKKTWELIPMCHPLLLDSIKFSSFFNQNSIVIECEVKLNGKTGVEMEALTGVSISALTIYDMCKAITHEIKIEKIELVEKKGGKRKIKDGVLCI